MRCSNRRPSDRPQHLHLCLEQLESRLPLTTIMPQSFGGERFDVSSRADLTVLVRVHDEDSQMARSGVRQESADQAGPIAGIIRDSDFPRNTNGSIQESDSSRNLGDQLRNASDDTVGRLIKTSVSSGGSNSPITGSALTTSWSTPTTSIARFQTVVERI